VKLLFELRRRRVFRLAGLYIVGAWVAIQVADIAFEALGIPGSALRFLFLAAALLFPVALLFGWIFDITPQGIVRTRRALPDDLAPALKTPDYAILAALAAVVIFVLVGSLGQVADESAIAPPVAADKPPFSVAVLPFSSGDSLDDSRAYADGISGAVLNRLASLGPIRVLARTSTFPFRDSGMTSRELSDILGVRYLLNGTVRRDNGVVHLEANLVDEAGFQVWVRSFERSEADVFEIQDVIALEVSQAIGVSDNARSRPTGPVTSNPTAYRRYLVGLEYVNSRPPGWEEAAESAFREALAEDPDFAPAYAGLATALYISPPETERITRQEQALEFARRGLELRPEIAETRAAMGLVLLNGDTADLEDARFHLERALEIDPSHADAYNWLAGVLGQLGQVEQREQVQERGLEVDPFNPALVTNVASRIEAQGDFERALAMRKRLLQMPTPPGLAYWAIYLQYFGYDHIAESIRWSKEAAVAYRGTRNQLAFFALAVLYEQLGLSEEADYWLDMLDRHHPDPLGTMIRRAYVSVLRGDLATLQDMAAKIAATGATRSTELPPEIQQRLGALFVAAGRAAEGARLLEAGLRVDQPVGPGAASHELAEMTYALAFAYRQLGETEKADAMLQRGHEIVSLLRSDELYADSPTELELVVYRHILSGDLESAGVALRKALDAGWTNYYWFYNNPTLGQAARSPELAPLFDEALQRVKEQRRIVEERDRSDNFKERIALLMRDSDL
jgi:TolB-like protein/tetratricopeptide (TPR) repeat protein